MDLDLVKKLHYFNMYANLGLALDGIDKYDKYLVAYHNQIKDCYYNFITDIDAKSKEEFDEIILEASSKLKERNRQVSVTILPFMKNLYNNREKFFDEEYELASNEIWQIYNDFDNVDDIETNCSLEIKLEKATNMELYGEEMVKAYQTGDEDDPYGNLDSAYKDAYQSFKNIDDKYIKEFYFAKVNDKIVGLTSCVYDNEIYGIYSLVVKKDFRCKGIGKEIIKQQLRMCKENNLKLAFLQTEDGYYPADMYRKLGFKDVCNAYCYIKK